MNFYYKLLGLFSSLFLTSILSFSQCVTCGNGVVDAGETNLNCPQDVSHSATCTSPCAQPTSFESVAGTRVSLDFTGTTTFSTAGLPAGWSFAGAPTATTAGALPAADAYGAKAGLVQPNCSGSCTATNGFCIGNLANTQAVGGGGASGKLGANFDGRANINANLSYAVLRGQSNPTLVSQTFNFASVESFKIQFWLFPSETSCGQTNSWGSCVGNQAFLDFSGNGGTNWTQIMTMDLSSASTDMAFNNSTNTKWLTESAWSRVCLTVFKSSSSPGNFYPAATGTTSASGIMMNSTFFTANFKFRIRYSQTASCTSGITTTNPGRYLAIDYPVITSGTECIPCGLSFSNMCGYGQDNNDDGVGGSGTSTTVVFGTTRRGVNNAERGVEIMTSQAADFTSQNLSGSNFASNFDLCNPEGGDQQCLDWEANNNFYSAVYEVISDIELPTSSINVQYYKGTTPQSFGLSKVTTAGKTASIGWRYSGTRFVSCGSTSDLNPGCNGYYFLTNSLPTQFARGFYALAHNSTGQSWSYYGASSASHYFSGPVFAPISRPDTVTGSPNYVVCDNGNPVFNGLVDYCFTSTGMSGSPTLSIVGPNGFSETLVSGVNGTTPIVDLGDYTITAATPNSPIQCVDCSRSVCVTITALDLDICNTPLAVELIDFTGIEKDRKVKLSWSTHHEENNDYFEVERSVDGLHYELICSEDGSGTTSSVKSYVCEDVSPILNSTNYYRLSQTDLDGTRSILKTIAVNCPGADELQFVSIGNNDFILSVDAKEFKNARFIIYDLQASKIVEGALNDGQEIVHLNELNQPIVIKVLGEKTILGKRFVLN